MEPGKSAIIGLFRKEQWYKNSWLKNHVTSKQEISNLVGIVHRDLETSLRNLNHYRTLSALPLILGAEKESDSKYLDLCRRKRHIVEYEYVGGVTRTETDEFIAFVSELKEEVLLWLKENHRELCE